MVVKTEKAHRKLWRLNCALCGGEIEDLLLFCPNGDCEGGWLRIVAGLSGPERDRYEKNYRYYLEMLAEVRERIYNATKHEDWVDLIIAQGLQTHRKTLQLRANPGAKVTHYASKRLIGRPRNDRDRRLAKKLFDQGKSWKQIETIINRKTGQKKTSEAYRSLVRSSS